MGQWVGDKPHTGSTPPEFFPGQHQEGDILVQCCRDKEELPVLDKAVPDQGTLLELVDSHRMVNKVLELAELCWMTRQQL